MAFFLVVVIANKKKNTLFECEIIHKMVLGYFHTMHGERAV